MAYLFIKCIMEESQELHAYWYTIKLLPTLFFVLDRIEMNTLTTRAQLFKIINIVS